MIDRRKSLDQPSSSSSSPRNARFIQSHRSITSRTVRSNSNVIFESEKRLPWAPTETTVDMSHRTNLDDVITWYGLPVPGEVIETCMEVNDEMNDSTNGGCTRLGLQLAGQVGNLPSDGRPGVFIAGILPDSPASKNADVRIGDQLIQVNNVKLLGCSHLNASALIKTMSSFQFNVVIFRRFAVGNQVKDQLEDDCAKHNLPSKSLCLTDITNVTLQKPDEKQQKPTSNSDKLPNNGDCHDDGTDVVQWNNGYVNCVTEAELSDVHCNTEESLYSCEFVENEKLRLTCNNEINSFEQNCNVQNCKLVSTDGVADIDNNADRTDVKSILVNDDTVESNMQHRKPITMVTVCNEQSVEQPSVATSASSHDQPTVLHPNQTKTIEVKAEIHKNGGSSRSDHATSDKEHKTTNKRKAGRTGHRNQHTVTHDFQTTNDNPLTCVPVPGQETVIEIDKGWQPLGICVIGGANTLLGTIVISEIFPGGAAERDGRLCVGDQILEVNGEDFRCDVTDEWATEVLHQTPGKVRLTIYRDMLPFNLHEDNDVFEVFTIDLLKKPGKGLGFSITGRQHDQGIFVSDVIKGGVADLDGQLIPGDQILVINGNRVHNATQPEIAALLKTLMGRVSLTIGRVRCLSRSSSSSSLSVDSDDVNIPGDQCHHKTKNTQSLNVRRQRDVNP